MPIDATKLEHLLSATRAGKRVPMAEYLRVDWDDSHTNYYAGRALQEDVNFVDAVRALGQRVEPRIKYDTLNDPFTQLELDPDLRTDTVNVTFDDIDHEIRGKFQTYSSGVACSFHIYYASVDGYAIDLDVEIWSGQLQAPQVYGWKTVKAVASNGYRSRELRLPGRNHRAECTASVFGGLLPDADAVRSSLCPYDRHIGGSVGLYRTGTTPFADCPKTRDACIARFGHAHFFGGIATTASAVNAIHHGHTFLATTFGNESNLKDAIRVVAGQKYVRGLQLLLWRRNSPPGYQSGFIAVLMENSEGPVQQIYDIRINDFVMGAEHMNIRLGERGQAATNYAPDVSNYSSMSHIYVVVGPLDTGTISGEADIAGECRMQGFNEVCVYTDPVTKTRIYTDDRVFWLLELYKNQKFGFGYAESKFELADWIDVSDWGTTAVTFTATFPDGETQAYTSQRTRFNAILEGRAAGEQIVDICNSGGISVPFEHEGKFTVAAFRAATAGELSSAKVFRDQPTATTQPNIICEKNQPPMIELSQTPDNKVVNEVEVRFEDVSNYDTETPITVDDPNWKLKAGRQLGPDYLFTVPKKFTAFGVTNRAEAVRLAYRLLKFGEFDDGGTDNNLRLKITVPFEHALSVRRYDVIKVESTILDGFTIGRASLAEDPQYFRVLSLKKAGGGRCEITAQAYNQTAYEAFEVDAGGGGGGGGDQYPVAYVSEAGTTCNGVYDYAGDVGGKVSYQRLSFVIAWSTTNNRWELTNGSASVLYYGATVTTYPWETAWAVQNGSPPACIVDYDIPPGGGGCRIDITGTTIEYDRARGGFNVTVPGC